MTRDIMPRRRSAEHRSDRNQTDNRRWPCLMLGVRRPLLDRAVLQMWPVILLTSFFIVAGIVDGAYGGTDVFRSSGGKWQVSFGGTGPWQDINTSSIGVSDLGFGDFDGDCRTDVFRSSGGKWWVSFAGTGPWQPINTSSIGLSSLRFGNFNGPATVGENTTGVCLQVSRYTTAMITNANADTILQSASNVLQTDDDGDGPNDVACLVQFTRRGPVTIFDDGDGSIDSSADFNTVIALQGFVKVVNQINWCGAIGFNIIGCAPVPGRSLVVVRFTANQEGILWAHEYGHTRGLEHNNAATAVMNGTISTTHLMVTPAECAAFKK